MRYIILLVLIFSETAFSEDIQSCGTTSIEQIITGPRHGALLNLKNDDCGNSGYVCIDIDGAYDSKEVANATYALVLASYMSQTDIQLSVDLDYKPNSCNGSYPVVQDVRTK